MQIFGAVFIWPFSVLIESERNFWTESDVRPVQVAKKLLLKAFFQEGTLGLKADQFRKSKSLVLVFCAYADFSMST